MDFTFGSDGRRGSGIPSFENDLISALFGPHGERMGSPKAPHLSWRDLFLDYYETRTRTSGLVIRDSLHQNTNLQLHFGARKNEGMPESAGRRSSRAARLILPQTEPFCYLAASCSGDAAKSPPLPQLGKRPKVG